MKHQIISRTALMAAALLTAAATQAQTPSQRQWTLRECADYAVAHNISIRQQRNQCSQQEIQLHTAKHRRLPDLNASASESFSFGRGLTMENTYADRNTSSTSLALSTSVPLFTGFEIPNTIKLRQLNLEAATQDLEKARNDIRMQVAQAYVQILYNMEIADVAHRQVAIDSMQVARLQSFVDNGKASAAQLSQQQATLGQAVSTATQADNNVRLALLDLSQLLELPSPEGFQIVRPTATATAAVPASPEVVFAEAVALKPEVQAEQLRLHASDRNIRIAQAGYYPTLSLNGGLQTNYYKTSGLAADGFGKQLKNNFAQYIGLSLSIPIFNRFTTRNSVRMARLDRDNQALQLDLVKKRLYKEIQQVYYNAVAAQAKYESSRLACQSGSDAFTLTQAKYENGKATITEFNEAKSQLLKAESDLVQARYEHLYQSALLDFYRGKPLQF